MTLKRIRFAITTFKGVDSGVGVCFERNKLSLCLLVDLAESDLWEASGNTTWYGEALFLECKTGEVILSVSKKRVIPWRVVAS